MIARAVYVAPVLILFAACAADNHSQTHQVDDYFITVTTEPQALKVGSDAEVTAHIGKDDEGVDACKISFRQYMPAHQMTSDHTLHSMEALGNGLYRGRGTDFSMGGDWELEFQFNCGDGMKSVVFPYQLTWM